MYLPNTSSTCFYVTYDPLDIVFPFSRERFTTALHFDSNIPISVGSCFCSVWCAQSPKCLASHLSERYVVLTMRIPCRCAMQRTSQHRIVVWYFPLFSDVRNVCIHKLLFSCSSSSHLSRWLCRSALTAVTKVRSEARRHRTSCCVLAFAMRRIIQRALLQRYVSISYEPVHPSSIIWCLCVPSQLMNRKDFREHVANNYLSARLGNCKDLVELVIEFTCEWKWRFRGETFTRVCSLLAECKLAKDRLLDTSPSAMSLTRVHFVGLHHNVLRPATFWCSFRKIWLCWLNASRGELKNNNVRSSSGIYKSAFVNTLSEPQILSYSIRTCILTTLPCIKE